RIFQRDQQFPPFAAQLAYGPEIRAGLKQHGRQLRRRISENYSMRFCAEKKGCATNCEAAPD
ncbi:MAG TPA: hypothetical protein PLK58_02940, partial [Candidatus Rifleibacterium sp.]|nr:hypothetical protein [Candidatus Rifleibacterium sp.]